MVRFSGRPALKSTEAGQILVFLSAGLVGLMAFTALVIDLGMVYADRRSAQNAADSAALSAALAATNAMRASGVSGASFGCDTASLWLSGSAGWTAPAWLTAANGSQTWLDDILQTAINRAASNGAAITVGSASQNGVDFRCASRPDRTFDVRVTVSTTTRTSILQLFFGGQMRSTVEAITRVRPSQAAYGGYAVVATDDSCSAGGISGTSGSGLAVSGGESVISLSCINPGSDSITVSDGGEINYASGGSGWVQGTLAPTAQSVSLTDLHKPTFPDLTSACSALPVNPPLLNGAYQPGNYPAGLGGGNLLPGLYCISGGITLQGSSSALTSQADASGLKGVTLYLLSGGITCLNSCTVALDAPANSGAAPASAVRGLAVLARSGSGQGLTAGADNSDSLNINGTVVFPDGEIDLGGSGQNASVLPATQWIGRSIRLAGGPAAAVSSDESRYYQLPVSLEMLK